LESVGNKDITAIAAQVDAAQPGLDRFDRAEEIYSVAVERGLHEKIGLLREWSAKLLQQVKAWLRKLGFDNAFVNTLTLNDVMLWAKESQRRLDQGGKGTDGKWAFAGSRGIAPSGMEDATNLPSPRLVVDDPLLATGLADTKNLPYSYILDIDAQGVMPGKLRNLDGQVSRKSLSLDAVAEGWNQTRAAIRNRYDDYVTLYRSDALENEKNPDTITAYFGDQQLAERFATDGRKAIPYSIAVNDIVAMYVRPSGYYEFIVKLKKADTDIRFSRALPPNQYEDAQGNVLDSEAFNPISGREELKEQRAILQRLKEDGFWKTTKALAKESRPAWLKLLTLQQKVEMLQDIKLLKDLANAFENTALAMDADKSNLKQEAFALAEEMRTEMVKARDKGYLLGRILQWSTV
jgi:hypothetical protein